MADAPLNSKTGVDSPFMNSEPIRVGFGTVVMMLMMVVAAGIGLLIFYAMRVPAITSELNAWMGRPNPVAETSQSRAAQVTFILIVYTAPLGLGMFVYGLHYVVRWLDRSTRERQRAEDEPFRME